MKKHFTKFVLIALTIAFFGQFSIAQTVIWGGPGDKNGEFDGGLNDWTTNAVSDTNALWVWEADAKADRGAYSGVASVLFSPSSSNGAAVFDSDYYDNDGTPGNFGNGPSPGPQTGELISPKFSCANESVVWLRFYQSYRNYQSTPKVYVSNDGGENWSPGYGVNTDVALNSSTKTNSVIFIDISEYAANQDEVQIKFSWEGNYYFWIIDDVTILNGLNADPRISNTWYSPNRYRTPQMQTVGVPMKFKMDVLNAGGLQDITGIKGTASIIKNYSEETIYTQSSTFDLASTDTITVDFDSFTPSTELDTGLYRAVYSIEYDDAASDFQKVVTHYFRITDRINETWDGANRVSEFDDYLTFEDGGRVRGIGWQGGSTADVPIYFVSYYKSADWVESDKVSVRAVELNQKVGTGAGEGLVEYPFDMALFKVADTIKEDFSNFANEDIAGIEVDNVENINLDYLGGVSETVENADEFSLLEYPITDADGENDYVDLQPNSKYFISTFFDANDQVYYRMGYDNSGPTDDLFNSETRYTYPDQVTCLRYYPGDQGGWTAYRSSYGAWIMGMKLHIAITPPDATKEDILPDNTVVFANPVKDKLVVNIDFKDNVEHVTMAIHSLTGEIIEMRNIYNMKKDIQTFNTGSLPTGTYVFTIFTKDKLLSKKFVVAK